MTQTDTIMKEKNNYANSRNNQQYIIIRAQDSSPSVKSSSSLYCYYFLIRLALIETNNYRLLFHFIVHRHFTVHYHWTVRHCTVGRHSTVRSCRWSETTTSCVVQQRSQLLEHVSPHQHVLKLLKYSYKFSGKRLVRGNKQPVMARKHPENVFPGNVCPGKWLSGETSVNRHVHPLKRRVCVCA